MVGEVEQALHRVASCASMENTADTMKAKRFLVVPPARHDGAFGFRRLSPVVVEEVVDAISGLRDSCLLSR